MSQSLALNERQARFVEHVVDGVPYQKAYALAGYAPKQQNAWLLIRHPAVSLAIRAEMTRRLQNEDAPAARRLLRQFVDDETVDKRLRADCAKTLLARGGYVEPKAAEIVAPGQKEASEMSTDELEAFISKAKQQLDARAEGAKDVTPIEDYD